MMKKQIIENLRKNLSAMRQVVVGIFHINYSNYLFLSFTLFFILFIYSYFSSYRYVFRGFCRIFVLCPIPFLLQQKTFFSKKFAIPHVRSSKWSISPYFSTKTVPFHVHINSGRVGRRWPWKILDLTYGPSRNRLTSRESRETVHYDSVPSGASTPIHPAFYLWVDFERDAPGIRMPMDTSSSSSSSSHYYGTRTADPHWYC